MKIVGLITEYNPFHNGHLYHIMRSKLQTGADFVIVAMSGDFVQRGAPAIYDKYLRTRMALSAGADLVLELPSLFATSSAEDFAACAIALFDKLGCVDSICFGSECGDIHTIESIAGFLLREPPEYKAALQAYLKNGNCFPDARNKALLDCIEPSNHNGHILQSPNNILAVEYVKALSLRKSSIKPVTIKRIGSDYHDTSFTTQFGSASAIRNAVYKLKNTEAISAQVPEYVLELMKEATPVFPDDLSLLLNDRALTYFYQGRNFTEILDFSPELSFRFQKYILNFSTFEERILQLKTKQYTHTRISRALLHLLLGMTESEAQSCRQKDYVSYARVLGFRRSSAEILTVIKHNSSIPLVTKTADAAKYLNPQSVQILNQDIYASHLYHSLVYHKTGRSPKNEYTQSVIRI